MDQLRLQPLALGNVEQGARPAPLRPLALDLDPLVQQVAKRSVRPDPAIFDRRRVPVVNEVRGDDVGPPKAAESREEQVSAFAVLRSHGHSIESPAQVGIPLFGQPGEGGGNGGRGRGR